MAAFEEEKEMILTAGCDDLVRKPFREADIFKAMGRHLGVRYVYEEGKREEEKDERPKAQGNLSRMR